MFWTRSSNMNLHEIAHSSSFSLMSTERTNYNLLWQLVVNKPCNQRSVDSQGNLFSSATRVCTETKKSVLSATQRIEFLGVLQKTQVSILELIKLIGLLFSTIQSAFPAQRNFRCLQQQQIQALKTQGSYWKKVILNRNPKEEHKIWKFAMVVTWFCLTVKCWYKQMHPKRDGVQYVKGYQQGANV